MGARTAGLRRRLDRMTATDAGVLDTLPVTAIATSRHPRHTVVEAVAEARLAIEAAALAPDATTHAPEAALPAAEAAA